MTITLYQMTKLNQKLISPHFRVFLDNVVLQDLQVLLDRKDLLDLLVQLAQLDLLDRLDPKAP
jgi:hypothetical protein